MNHGLTDEHLESGFAASPEYFATNGGTYPGLVQRHVSRPALATPTRPASTTGWASCRAAPRAWPAWLTASRASKERESIRVTDDYLTYLGRGPDQDGLNYWLNAFLTGVTNETLVGGFVGSVEYFYAPKKGMGNEADVDQRRLSRRAASAGWAQRHRLLE